MTASSSSRFFGSDSSDSAYKQIIYNIISVNRSSTETIIPKETYLLEQVESIWSTSMGCLVRMDDYISNNVRVRLHIGSQQVYSRAEEAHKARAVCISS